MPKTKAATKIIPADLRPYLIGIKLRTLRNEKRYTLARLSIETGLSAALLSKLETDHMVPTLQTLARICRIYGIGLSYFFAEPTHSSVAITRKARIAGDRREQPTLRHLPLHVPTAQSKLLATIVDIHSDVPSALNQHGEIAVYVIDGTLTLTHAGYQETLSPGDCAVLVTDQPILWSAARGSRCRVLSVSVK